MTVLEVIQRTAEFLNRKGIESPRLQIELLLAHVLQTPRLHLYLQHDRVLSESELDILRGLVKRRGEREPLQHILGTTSFCGLEMGVSPAVLIPRPETELLAEKAWTFLNHQSVTGRSPLRVLDWGTGSGCLAISIAKHCPTVQVHAVDISPTALPLAQENAARYAAPIPIVFHLSDGFTSLPAGITFDLIVSNPPYISTGEIQALAAEVRDHDPRLALDGGVDGLAFYRRLAVESPPFLNSTGWLMLELGDNQAEPVRELLSASGWQIEFLESDYQQKPRMIGASRAG